MADERRMFQREKVGITFIYSLDKGDSLSDGDWEEAVTDDIGPVLVGGMAFFSKMPLQVNQKIRIALFMDKHLREVWLKENEGFPAVYHGRVCRCEKYGVANYRIAVEFKGFENSVENISAVKESSK